MRRFLWFALGAGVVAALVAVVALVREGHSGVRVRPFLVPDLPSVTVPPPGGVPCLTETFGSVTVPCRPGQWGIFEVVPKRGTKRRAFGIWEGPLPEMVEEPEAAVTIHAFVKGRRISAHGSVRALVASDSTPLEIVPEGTNLRLPPDLYVFSAWTDSRYGEVGPIELEPGRAVVEIHLRKAVKVRGLVRSQKGGRPIAGASISLRRDFPSLQELSATTDARGRFVIPHVLPGAYALSVWAEGHVPMLNVGYWISESPSLILLDLDPGHTIRGVVRDEQGRPVGGARVSLYGTAADSSVVSPTMGAWSTTTGDGGSFELHGVPMGFFHVSASTAAGEAGTRNLGWVSRSINDLKITVHPRSTVTGRLLDERGQPVSGYVRITSEDDPLYVTYAAPGPDGVFTIRNAPPVITVEASSPGYTPVVRRIRSDRNEFTITLTQASRRLELRFVDPNGIPVRGTVTLASQRPWFEATRRTDGSGTALFRGAPRLELSWTFTPEGSFPTLRGRIDDSTEARTITVPFGVTIRAYVRDASTLEGLRATVSLSDSAGSVHQTSTSDGEVSLPNVAPGKAEVAVWAEGYAPYVRTIEIPKVDYAGQEAPMDLLWELARGRSLRGTVTDSHGRPAPHAMVGWDHGMTRTRADGTFTLGAVPRGRVTVWAWHPSLGWTVSEIQAEDMDETPVDLTLGRPSVPRFRPTSRVLQVGSVVPTPALPAQELLRGYGVAPVLEDGIVPRWVLVGFDLRKSRKN